MSLLDGSGSLPSGFADAVTEALRELRDTTTALRADVAATARAAAEAAAAAAVATRRGGPPSPPQSRPSPPAAPQPSFDDLWHGSGRHPMSIAEAARNFMSDTTASCVGGGGGDDLGSSATHRDAYGSGDDNSSPFGGAAQSAASSAAEVSAGCSAPPAAVASHVRSDRTAELTLRVGRVELQNDRILELLSAILVEQQRAALGGT
jgi:hypothetical protein